MPTMYGTAVNQLVTVAVFLVLQSIQLAGYQSGENITFSRATSVLRLHDSGTGRGHSLFVIAHNRAFLRPSDGF